MIEIRSEDFARCLGHITVTVRDGPHSLWFPMDHVNPPSTLRRAQHPELTDRESVRMARKDPQSRIWTCATPDLLIRLPRFIPSPAYSAPALGLIETAFEDAQRCRRWPPEGE